MTKRFNLRGLTRILTIIDFDLQLVIFMHFPNYSSELIENNAI